MNYIPPWFFDPSLSDNFVSGLGSVADPYIFTLVTGQCTSVRADLIRSSVGYLNPLFKGYGHGHVDWTLRFINLDYGGRHTSSGNNFFLGIKGGILALQSPSNKDVDELNNNQTTFIHLQNELHLFVEKPWLSDSDKTKFLEPFNLR